VRTNGVKLLMESLENSLMTKFLIYTEIGLNFTQRILKISTKYLERDSITSKLRFRRLLDSMLMILKLGRKDFILTLTLLMKSSIRDSSL